MYYLSESNLDSLAPTAHLVFHILERCSCTLYLPLVFKLRESMCQCRSHFQPIILESWLSRSQNICDNADVGSSAAMASLHHQANVVVYK